MKKLFLIVALLISLFFSKSVNAEVWTKVDLTLVDGTTYCIDELKTGIVDSTSEIYQFIGLSSSTAPYVIYQNFDPYLGSNGGGGCQHGYIFDLANLDGMPDGDGVWWLKVKQTKEETDYHYFYATFKLYKKSITFSTTTGYSNVLFIPGLEASRLYLNENGSENQLWEPNRNLDVEKLYLNTDGTSINEGIYTRDIIGETNIPTSGSYGQNIYKSFSKMLDDLVSTTSPDKMARWEAYAYDWRQGVEDIVNNGTKYQDGNKSLITTLENLVASSTTGKATVIAHSNGGLIAKALMIKLQGMKDNGTSDLIDKIDNLILVAVPQIGTASAVPAMLNGYDQAKLGGLLMTQSRARELGRNMKSAYGLLPSKEYINRIDISPVTFTDTIIPSGVTTPYINYYGTILDSYTEYIDFLKGAEGRNEPAVSDTFSPIKLSTILFLDAEVLHNKIDAWVPPESMRVINVAGWGLDTVASFEYYPKYLCTNPTSGGNTLCANVMDEKPIFTVDGDKTVVEPSALYGGGEKVWINLIEYNKFFSFNFNREHKDILEIDSLNNLIKSVIKKTDIIFDTVLKNSKPVDTKNRLRISIHSPVEIGAYDTLGNFTGKVCPTDSDFCYAQEDIPNSSYLEFGEGKYINLLEEDIQKIALQGVDIGTFTYESIKVMPDGQSATTTFIDIPVTTQTIGEVVINPNTQNPEIRLDVNNDGSTDITVQPSSVFDPISYLQVMKKTVENLDITNVRKNNFIKRIDNTIKAIEKGKINKAILKAERFTSILEKRIVKKDSKHPKPHRLSKSDAELLLSMLDTLLINLNK